MTGAHWPQRSGGRGGGRGDTTAFPLTARPLGCILMVLLQRCAPPSLGVLLCGAQGNTCRLLGSSGPVDSAPFPHHCVPPLIVGGKQQPAGPSALPSAPTPKTQHADWAAATGSKRQCTVSSGTACGAAACHRVCAGVLYWQRRRHWRCLQALAAAGMWQALLSGRPAYIPARVNAGTASRQDACTMHAYDACPSCRVVSAPAACRAQRPELRPYWNRFDERPLSCDPGAHCCS